MITAYVPRRSQDRQIKLSEYLKHMLDSIMCDVEFCASAEETVEVVNEHFSNYIKAAEEIGN